MANVKYQLDLFVACREDADVDERLTQGNANRHVDPKRPNGRASALRLAFENGVVPLEMPLPILAARIEESNDLAGSRIDAGQICSLVQVAWDTGICPIFMTIRTVMDLGDDVIELERQVVVFLRHAAILATIMCPFSDQVCGSSVHVNQEVVFFKLPRILAFKIDRRCPTWT